MNKTNSRIWAEFRFSVIGTLINSVVEKGRLKKQLISLSRTIWKDPIDKQNRQFSYSTIERWYYRALNSNSMGKDPIEVLGKVRSDYGNFNSLTKNDENFLKNQYLKHCLWSYQIHYDQLVERKRKQNIAISPSYSTVSRYIKDLEDSDERENKYLELEKANKLIGHLRRTLIAGSVKNYILKSTNERFLNRFPILKNISLTFHEKKYVLDSLEKYKKAGGNISSFCKQTGKSECSISRWNRAFIMHGIQGLLDKRCNPNYSKKKRAKFFKHKKKLSKNLLEILHNQPMAYGINRSNWSGKSLAQAYENKYGKPISVSTVGRHIRNSGYSLKRAKTVLVSNDPDYRDKVDRLLHILQNLCQGELLFFIDEMGPLRVKKYGGRSYVKDGEIKTIPQIQPYKGSVTICGALSATTNLLTWFFGNSKDTSAMIDLIEILYNQHFSMNKLYITWDAASWHHSFGLNEWIDDINEYRMTKDNGPEIELVPLPSCSQFLNVIETVFSTMKKAVIYNSNYQSELEMKWAISKHFQERNDYFRNNPRRAGKKIWDIDFFSDFNNIKSGNYREW